MEKNEKRIAYFIATLVIFGTELLIALFVHDKFIRPYVGDIMVVVDITIPTSLTSEEKELVKKLADKPHFKEAESVENQNIFERMKNFFR